MYELFNILYVRPNTHAHTNSSLHIYNKSQNILSQQHYYRNNTSTSEKTLQIKYKKKGQNSKQ